MSNMQELIAYSQAYARREIPVQVPVAYCFHDLVHTEQMVGALRLLSTEAGLNERETAILEIAGWFHDLGYAQGPNGHEARSAELARKVLAEQGADPALIQDVEACILATRMPQQPQDHLQSLMCDADLSHLGTPEYWTFAGKLRQEFLMSRDKVMSEPEWLRFEIHFLEEHKYHTAEAERLYGKLKRKHIKKLYGMLTLYTPDAVPIKIEDEVELEAEGKKFGRGVETMFRSAYRTHINLSSIADNKANIMLSINAIIVSITVSTLVPRFGENSALVIPTILLLVVCLIAIIFATLSTRPKITKGEVTRESVQQKEANLLFFGNFYNMSLKDYQWGMDKLIGDKKFIYRTMTRDLYFLGIVLAKKYAYLRWCYTVFMWGLIAAVVAFALAFLL